MKASRSPVREWERAPPQYRSRTLPRHRHVQWYYIICTRSPSVSRKTFVSTSHLPIFLHFTLHIFIVLIIFGEESELSFLPLPRSLQRMPPSSRICLTFRNMLKGCEPPAEPRIWRTTRCRLSAKSKCSQPFPLSLCPYKLNDSTSDKRLLIGLNI
jgi:hypothetical protein